MKRRTFVYTAMAAALTAATAVTAATATTAFAGNGGLKLPPPPVHMKVKSVILGIKSPNGCGIAKMKAFFRANKKGKINFLLVRNNGKVYGPYSVQTKKYGGEYRASWAKNVNLVNTTSSKYRVVVTHSGKPGSNWVPMKASC